MCGGDDNPRDMTIDSGWVRVFKENAPRAFTQTCPFQPKVAYIDGMPLLMLAEGRVQQWSDFLRSNFARSIIRYFRLGCEAVVLAFDDYDHVPKAKAITQRLWATQANRAKAKATYDFGEGHQLPPTIPHKYNEKLTNRVFKRRVIDMICNCILDHVTPLPLSKQDAQLLCRKFVIDYSGCPIQFTCPAGSLEFGRQPCFLTELPPLGEADIKYLRWAQVFQGNLVAFSVDGDFIPIALIHHERLLQQHCGTLPYNIALYRIRYRMPEAKKSKATATGRGRGEQLQLTGSKRASDGRMMLSASAPPVPAAAAPAGAAPLLKQKRKAREYEYVDISSLYVCLRNALNQCCAVPSHEMHYMRMLSVLVGLSGTDFSRNLPHVGPTTMWSLVAQDDEIFAALAQSYNPERNGVRVADACNLFACRVYAAKFASHLKSGGGGSLRSILDVLKAPASKLADKTKRELPSCERVETTFRNINWLLQYWLCRPPEPAGHADDDGTLWDRSACFPDPISPEFGFVAGSGTGCVVQWLDTATATTTTT